MATIGFGGKNVLDIVKYRYLWLGLSGVFVIPCLILIIYCMCTFPTHTPVKLGIDFTGGTFLQYGFEQKFNVNDIGTIRKDLEKINLGNSVIQIQEPTEILGKIKDKVTKTKPKEENKSQTNSLNEDENKNLTKEQGQEQNVPKSTENANIDKTSSDQSQSISKTSSLDMSKIKTVVSLRTKFLDDQEIKQLNGLLKESYGNFSIIQVSAIGPALGKELLKNALMALLLVMGGIVAYLSFRFQLDYAICALIALLHDAIFVIGIFSLFGLLFNTEVDSLFVTAVLTVIGFSVHDTIVVFDRIRENARFLSKKKSFNEICNDSVNQTLARSINTSLTVIITLFCLYAFGGVTTRDFVLAMLLGIIVGTYSSIFNASVLLCLWREINAPKQRKRRITA